MRTALRKLAVTLAAATALCAVPALAQNDRMVAIPNSDMPTAITLNTGPLPGATAQESWHQQYGSKFARNVTVATLTPFLPDPSKATGAAVVVTPGGGFRTLSMENEGWDVARALNAKGIAAFVLKYRLNQTPASLEEFAKPMSWGPPPGAAPAAGAAAAGPPPRPSPEQMMAGIKPMIEDSRAAFALIRANATKWGVDPDRIGMVGFSAGAALTMATMMRGEEAKPAFIGNIYGGVNAMDIPADAPPLFVALAADDPLFPPVPDFGLIASYKKAKRPVEFHYYEQGGHGFGMYPKTTTSTGWFEAFASWMKMHGYMAKKGG